MKNISWEDQYKKDLKSKEWKKFSDKIKDRAQWKCELCTSIHKILHIHHKTYIKGRKPWQYNEELVCCLCDDCHWAHHHCPACGIKMKTYFDIDICLNCEEIFNEISRCRDKIRNEIRNEMSLCFECDKIRNNESRLCFECDKNLDSLMGKELISPKF